MFTKPLYEDVTGLRVSSKPINQIADPDTAPTLSLAAHVGSVLNATTYYAAYAWSDGNGVTKISPIASIDVTADNDLQVVIPALPNGVVSADIFVSQSKEVMFKQISITGTTYTQSSKLISGDQPSSYNTTGDWCILSTRASSNEVILDSQARTASGESGVIDVAEYEEAVLFLDVTAAAGTTPTLDVKVQTQDPASGKWFDLVSFTQKTAVASEMKTISGLLGSKVKVTYTVGGTTPSFTFTVGAVFKS